MRVSYTYGTECLRQLSLRAAFYAARLLHPVAHALLGARTTARLNAVFAELRQDCVARRAALEANTVDGINVDALAQAATLHCARVLQRRVILLLGAFVDYLDTQLCGVAYGSLTTATVEGSDMVVMLSAVDSLMLMLCAAEFDADVFAPHAPQHALNSRRRRGGGIFSGCLVWCGYRGSDPKGSARTPFHR